MLRARHRWAMGASALQSTVFSLPFALLSSQESPLHYQRHGGIAQLVERQLCKLEVRGSNPLASKAA